MPEVESFRFPSREGRCNEQDQEELEVCSGRRRTCALLNSPLPCVNKAFQNIQELKVTVEHWYQQPGKRQKEIGQDKHRYNKAFRFPSRDNESVTSAELFIEDSCPLSPLLKKINDVLREVVCLIERLEADRQYAEDALHKEQRIKRFLENKVDSMSVWKQQEHSVVVQKEHEACLRDITELKWQLKLESEKLDRAQEKLSHTERLNRRLHEDISFSKKQIPIVKENLALQSDIINQINTTQAEADALLLKMHHDLELIQHEFKKMELDTSVEKMSLDSELLRKRKNQLVKRLKDLNQLKMHEKGLCAEIKDAERTIVLTEEKNVEITQRILEIMEVEKTEKEAIFQLKLQIEEELQQNMKLKEKVISLQEDIEKTRIHGQTEVSFIEEELNSKRKAFSAFQNESMEYEHNIDAYKRKLLESEKAVKQMHEERKQMLQKIIDNDKHVEKAKEEVTQVVAQHSAIQNKLEKQEQLIVTEERRARVDIEKLRRDPTGQTAVLGLLEDKCATINEELHRFNRSSEITNQNLQKEFQDASSEAGAQETKLGKIKKLTENLEKMQCEHRNTLVKLDKEKELRCVYLKAAQDLHTATIKRHDGTIGRISDLTRKSQECRAALVKMEKIAESLPGVIADLQGVFDVVESKNKSAALIMSTLQSDINNCQQRTQRSMQTHTAHVTAGKKELEGTKNSLIFALIENKHLARRYEDLQKILMEAKQEELSAFGKKKHIHVSFHFYKQLSLLQKRMHKAMVKYFKHRSLYSQAELDRCQALSRETDQKIKTVQEGLSEEIQLISTFLQHLTDDSTTSSDAGVNKQASPDAEWK